MNCNQIKLNYEMSPTIGSDHSVYSSHNTDSFFKPKNNPLEQITMCVSRKFCQIGSNFDSVFVVVFLVDEGREDPNTTISGPSSMMAQH